jgi:hypothetical protein
MKFNATKPDGLEQDVVAPSHGYSGITRITYWCGGIGFDLGVLKDNGNYWIDYGVRKPQDHWRDLYLRYKNAPVPVVQYVMCQMLGKAE